MNYRFAPISHLQEKEYFFEAGSLSMVCSFAKPLSESDVLDFSDYATQVLKSYEVNTLEDLTKAIHKVNTQFFDNNVTAFSCYFVSKQSVTYFLASEGASVYLGRRGKYYAMAADEVGASGVPEEGDECVLSLQSATIGTEYKKDEFWDLFGSVGYIISTAQPEETDVSLDTAEETRSETPEIAYEDLTEPKTKVVSYAQELQQNLPLKQPVYVPRRQRQNVLGNLPTLSFPRLNKKMLIGIGIVILIGAIIKFGPNLPSLGKDERITNLQTRINIGLSAAESESFFNISGAAVKLEELNQAIALLEKDYPKGNAELTKAKTELIAKSDKILRKSPVNAVEFYDLTLESQSASGARASLQEENLLILDTTSSKIYELSIKAKSIKKQDTPTNSTQIAAGEENAYVVSPEGGVFNVSASEPKQVVKKDDDWDTIADAKVFNGNLYLLDSGSSNIIKYPAAGGGDLATASAYFSGGSSSLNGANSFAIDSAIYVSVGDKIIKYLSGESQEFKVAFPTTQPQIAQIYTNENIEQIFALDKNKKAVYVLSKTGEYIKELTCPEFGTATDFVVFENSIYLLSGSKIYKVDIPS